MLLFPLAAVVEAAAPAEPAPLDDSQVIVVTGERARRSLKDTPGALQC
jgi:outer membrane receptor protein involved in Fe transport